MHSQQYTSRRWRLLGLFVCSIGIVAALGVVSQSSSVAEVLITEIMYNPDGSDSDATAGISREWVEVFNPSVQPIDIGGWQFADLQDDQYASLIPQGTFLGAGEAIVLTGDAQTFDNKWGAGIARLELADFPTLSNSPSPTNETVAFYDPVNGGGDVVNYDDEGNWPSDSPDGASLMLRPDKLNASQNNLGSAWIPSMWGAYGARFVRGADGTEDRASPGFVETVAQSPFAPSPDAAWSIAVLPDTQNYSKSSENITKLSQMTQWIKENVDTWNVQVVIHEGDIVNQNSQVTPTSGDQSGDQQWQNAKAAMSTLDGVVPYIFAPGNHDYGTTNAQNRNTLFNDYFKATDNPLVDPAQGGILAGTLRPNELDSAYYDFTAPDGRQMLLMTLEWGPRQSVVDDANQIMSSPEYADHTAILATHAYMFHDETRYDWSRNLDSDPNNNQGGNPYSYATAGDTNDGQDLWEELVSQHDQFEAVLSGHVGGDGVGYLAEAGSGGQQVHQMLFNTQFESGGGNGWLRIFEFLNDGKTVRVRTYSPFHDLAKTDPANDFTFEITPITPLLPGDFNDDGVVNLADYSVWRDALGAGAESLPNDMDGGTVGAAQYATWKQNFGAARPPATVAVDSVSSAVAVPEPHSFGWIAVGLVAMRFIGGKR